MSSQSSTPRGILFVLVLASSGILTGCQPSEQVQAAAAPYKQVVSTQATQVLSDPAVLAQFTNRVNTASQKIIDKANAAAQAGGAPATAPLGEAAVPTAGATTTEPAL
jgi:hypothetical protein